MASVAELKDALITAHNQGDTQGAEAIAGEIKRIQALPPGRGFVTGPLTQGATLGFGDEMRAALGAGLDIIGGRTAPKDFGERYKTLRDIERGALERYQTEYPGRAIAGEIAGGALLGLPGGVLAAGTGAGRSLAANIAARPIGQRLMLGGLLGGGLGASGGAIAGAGQAPEMADVPGAALTGAAWGLPFGLLGAGASEAASSTARAIGSAMRRSLSPERASARAVERAISRSGLTPGDALARAEHLGPQATLADVAESTREALETVAQQPGAARGMAVRQLGQRSRAQASDLLGAAGEGRKTAVLDDLEQIRSTQASPLYERAFDRGVDHNKVLEKVFTDLDEFAPGLWNDAKRLGRLIEANKGNTAPDMGDVRPSLRGWQYVKEQLDDLISAARRSGDNKRASALDGARKRLLSELDRQNPDFREARGLWAGAARFEEVMDQAGKFMTEPSDAFLRRVRDLSDTDLEAVRAGAIQAIQDRIERGQWTHDVAKFFRTPAMDKKMAALFPNAKEFADFKSRLSAVTQQQRTFDAVRGGSPTARRQAAQQETRDWISEAMGIIGEEIVGQGTTGRVARAAARQLQRFAPSQQEAARTLTASQLLEVDPAVRALQQQARQSLLGQPMPPPSPAMGLLPAGIGAGMGLGSGLLLQ